MIITVSSVHSSVFKATLLKLASACQRRTFWELAAPERINHNPTNIYQKENDIQHRNLINTYNLRRSLQNIFDDYTNVVVCLRHGVLICESGMLTAVVLWHFLLMSKLRLGSLFVPRVLCSAVYCSLCVLCSMFSVLDPYLLRASHGVNTQGRLSVARRGGFEYHATRVPTTNTSSADST